MLLGCHLERLLGPNTCPMAGDVIIILGSAHHLNRNHTCCIKHRPGACHSPRNARAWTCKRLLKQQRPVIIFSLSLFFHFLFSLFIFCFSIMGPKPIAAMESIKTEICLPPLPARSTEKLRRANGPEQNEETMELYPEGSLYLFQNSPGRTF